MFEVRRLRRQGKNIKTIAGEAGVSKSSVSIWCRDIELTDEQKQALIESDKRGGAIGRAAAAECKIRERLNRLKMYMRRGKKMLGRISGRDLFVAGVALYWAEGNKKNRRLLFSNSDPTMIRMWLKWLTKCLGVKLDDIYCRVGINQLHQYRVNKVERFWAGITGIPTTRFRRVSLKKVKASKVYENTDEHFGTLNVIVRRSTNLNYLMLGLIDGLGNFEADS